MDRQRCLDRQAAPEGRLADRQQYLLIHGLAEPVILAELPVPSDLPADIRFMDET